MTQPSYQPPSGSLIVRQGPLAGQSFLLTKADITIGRVMGNDVIINHPQVSRRHARLTWDGRRFIIQDLGSTNGTFVNGVRITASQPLKDGDAINYTYGGWNPAYRTRATTDVDGEVNESDKGNNSRQLVVNVQPP